MWGGEGHLLTSSGCSAWATCQPGWGHPGSCRGHWDWRLEPGSCLGVGAAQPRLSWACTLGMTAGWKRHILEFALSTAAATLSVGGWVRNRGWGGMGGSGSAGSGEAWRSERQLYIGLWGLLGVQSPRVKAGKHLGVPGG